MEKRINSLDELKHEFDELLKANAIFRGTNSKKQLLPKIIRDKNCSKKEHRILYEFEKYYGLYSTANNCWEFLALAQHSGLMTRLIDFSWNPYVALFFALYVPKCNKDEYLILAIKKQKTAWIYEPGQRIEAFSFDNDNHSLTLNDDVKQKVQFCDILQEKFEEIKNKKKILIIEPNYRNERMLMQQGLFVIPQNLDDESIYERFETNTIKLIINEKIRDEALRYLDKLGYNEYRLMPDINSLCYEINKKFLSKIK